MLNLSEIKKKVFKGLSTTLLRSSELLDELSEDDVDNIDVATALAKCDYGVALTKEDGVLQVYVHSTTEENAFNILLDLVASNFSEHVYTILVEKFPNVANKVQELVLENLEKSKQDLSAALQPNMDDPLVSPLIQK